jgi:DNA-binding PadR family transcriptional regulator
MDLGARTALLLGLREGPGFGLELIARVKARTRERVSLNRGGTSIALRQLERQGVVRGWIRPTGASGRPRRYYELTSRGITEAERAREILDGFLRSDLPSVAASEARRMAERVRRSGEWSALALRVRSAARRAGVR